MSSENLGLLIIAFFGVLKFAYNVAVIATCTYVVFWLGYSGWWYLLAIVLCGGGSSDTKEKSS